MTFKEKLVVLRKEHRLTQEEFARRVGVSRQSVYKWECGQSYPEAVTLLAIRRLFAVSIDVLLDDTLPLPSAAAEAVEASALAAEPSAAETPVAEPPVAEPPVAEASAEDAPRGIFRWFRRRK